jgi:hypothetical protein
VSEDRFADLGPSRPRGDDAEEASGRSAAERFAELDEREPEPEPPKPPPSARPGGRYGWVVGIAFILVVIVAGANALRNSGEGYQGVPAGEILPPFAAPLAVDGAQDKDVNLRKERDAGKPAACEIRGPMIFNVCDARAEKPLVMTFVANARSDCEDQLDRVERVRRSFPRVGFVGVISRRDLDEAQGMVRDRGWGFPVVQDRDAQLFNAYGIGDCPTTVFAHRGGKVRTSKRGKLTEAQLRAEAAALR